MKGIESAAAQLEAAIQKFLETKMTDDMGMQIDEKSKRSLAVRMAIGDPGLLEPSEQVEILAWAALADDEMGRTRLKMLVGEAVSLLAFEMTNSMLEAEFDDDMDHAEIH